MHAMAVHGAPETLAQQLGMENDEAISYDLATKITAKLNLKKIRAPDWYDMGPRMVKLLDLPVVDPPTDPARRRNGVSHLLDFCMDVPDLYQDRESIVGLMNVNEVTQLRGVLPPKARVAANYNLNFVILPGNEDGRVNVIKHYVFDGKVAYNVIEVLVQGQPKLINMGQNKRGGFKAFVYLWHRLGGFQVHVWSFLDSENKKAKDLESADQINLGYDWIEENAPKQKSSCKQLRWIDIERQRPESPVYGWTAGRISNSIHTLRESGQQADTEEYYPLCFGHIEPWFQEILKEWLHALNDATLLLLGIEGMGKTPVQYIIGFAMSRLRISQNSSLAHKPAVRAAPDFDHFKNEVGYPKRSTLFDDGDLNRMPPRKSKSFFDGRKHCSLTTERFISAKFVRGEFRSAADNKVCLEAEPHKVVDGVKAPADIDEPVSYDDFVRMVAPAFPEDIGEVDIAAILKRTLTIVNTNFYIYVRPPVSKRQHLVKKYKIGSDYYITKEARALLKKWSTKGVTPAEDILESMVAAEQAFFATKIGKDAPGSESDNDEPTQSQIAPVVVEESLKTLVSTTSKRRHELLEVKIEQEESFFESNRKLQASLQGESIDVEGLQPPKRRCSQKTSSVDPLPMIENAAELIEDDALHSFHSKLAQELNGEAINVEESDGAEAHGMIEEEDLLSALGLEDPSNLHEDGGDDDQQEEEDEEEAPNVFNYSSNMDQP